MLYPECPKCEREIIEWWDGLSTPLVDGDVVEFCCHRCEEDFKAILSIDYNFMTAPKEVV